MNITGITSGANSIDTLIEQFMARERQPVQELESQKKELSRRLTVFTDLKSKLSALRDIARDFTRIGALNRLNAKKAILSDSGYVSATATAGALTGIHTIKVNRLATIDTGVSRQLTRSTTWEWSTGVQEFTLAAGDNDPVTISVTIDPADTNEQVITKVADAINEADIEVSASVIYDTADTARLVIKSPETGSESFLNMEDINGSNILRKLDFLSQSGKRQQTDGTSGGFLVQDVADLDASFDLDGINIIKTSNEISDVIEGVTLKLLKTHAADDSPVTVTVSDDTENIRKEIDAFFEKFNEIINYLNEKTRVDPQNNIRGDLVGDVIFSGLKFSLRSIVSETVTGLQTGDPQMLAQIGIELSRVGTLSIKDSTKYEEAVGSNPGQVTQLFTAENGIGQKLTDLLNRFVNAGGRVDRSKQGINRQISSIDTRISNYEARLAIREESLRRQFTELQKSLSILNSQQALLQSYQSFNLQNYLNTGAGY